MLTRTNWAALVLLPSENLKWTDLFSNCLMIRLFTAPVLSGLFSTSVATFPDLSESADWSDGQKFDHQVFNKHVFLWGQTSSPLAAQLCCGHSGRTERVLLVAAVTPESGRKFSPHPAESLLSSSCFSEANLFFFTCRLWIFSHICGKKGKTQIVWI